jgi:hypothetical protein
MGNIASTEELDEEAGDSLPFVVNSLKSSTLSLVPSVADRIQASRPLESPSIVVTQSPTEYEQDCYFQAPPPTDDSFKLNIKARPASIAPSTLKLPIPKLYFGSETTLLSEPPRINKMAASENVLAVDVEDSAATMLHGSSGSLLGGLDPFQYKNNWGNSTQSSHTALLHKSSIPFGLSALSIQSEDDYNSTKPSLFTRPSFIPPPNYPAPTVPRTETFNTSEVRALTRRDVSSNNVEVGKSPIICGDSPPQDRRASKDICITIEFASEDELGLPTGTKLPRSFVRPDTRRYSASTQIIAAPDVYQQSNTVRQFGQVNFINRPLSSSSNHLGYTREFDVSTSNVSGFESDSSVMDHDNSIQLELGTLQSSYMNLRDPRTMIQNNSGNLGAKNSGDTIKRVRRSNNKDSIKGSPQPYQEKMKKLGLAKCNSCSTLFVDYTLIMADLSETVTWYAIDFIYLVLQSQFFQSFDATNPKEKYSLSRSSLRNYIHYQTTFNSTKRYPLWKKWYSLSEPCTTPRN